MKKITVIVATHKLYSIPKNEYLLPVFAGASTSSLQLPYQRDDEGENISFKNKYYCELTALYWAYKNLKADYIGLCHYRRLFDLRNVDIFNKRVILPKKRHYYIETVYDQFKHAHGSAGLDAAREIIKMDYPEYLNSFDGQMCKRSLHIYNMFIMKYDLFIDYCHFLFDVLGKIEEKLGNEDRLYGFIGERLLDVYLNAHNIDYYEVKVINTEPINWPKKIYEFICRKFENKE